MPFIEKKSDKLTDGQITSMAMGVTTWVKAMYDFFREIPSLTKDPQTIFIKPEGDLGGNFDFKDGDFEGRLAIKGRYDALMFNVDKTEARLFEFKGLKKSDVTVPLSQTLIYAWLLYKSTGIIPSIEIIYLDEHEQTPIIFTAKTVREMIISALPDLFVATFNVISLRRAPEILMDKELCKSCKYRTKCETNVKSMFEKKRAGASLLSVLIFFMAAMMIMTQAFFFATNSSESLAEERQLVGIRMKLAEAVEYAKEEVKKKTNVDVSGTPDATYTDNVATNCYGFYKVTRQNNTHLTFDDKNHIWSVDVHDLNYNYIEAPINEDWVKQSGKGNMHKKIFPAMGEGYYLIRAYAQIPAGTWLMYQVLVKHINTSTPPEVLSYEEIWY